MKDGEVGGFGGLGETEGLEAGAYREVGSLGRPAGFLGSQRIASKTKAGREEGGGGGKSIDGASSSRMVHSITEQQKLNQRNTRSGPGHWLLGSAKPFPCAGGCGVVPTQSPAQEDMPTLEPRRLRLSKGWHLTQGHKTRKQPRPGRLAGSISADTHTLLAGAPGI